MATSILTQVDEKDIVPFEITNVTGRSFTIKLGVAKAHVEQLSDREIHLVDQLNGVVDREKTEEKEQPKTNQKYPSPTVDRKSVV